MEAENASLRKQIGNISEQQEQQGQFQVFEQITERAGDGIAIADLNGVFTYCNKAIHEIYGYDFDSQEMIDKTIPEVWPPDLLEYLQATVLPKIMTEGLWQEEVRGLRKDGGQPLLACSVFPITGVNGDVVSIAAHVRDVTQSRAIEAERERMISILESTVDFVGMATPDEQVMYINKAWKNFMGYDGDAAVHTKIGDYFRPGEMERFAKEVLPYAMEHNVWSGENVLRAPDGREIPVLQVFILHKDADGNPNYFSTIMRDVSAQKADEAERERLQQEIIEAQQRALRELSTPIIPLFEDVLVMPLIGSIDSARAQDIMRNLLSGITEHRAKIVIVDITGVPIVDSGVADHLNKTIQAARLKGARIIVTGISDEVAETIVDLGIDWNTVETLRDLQSGLLLAIKHESIVLQ